jgi:hypothetical protein
VGLPYLKLKIVQQRASYGFWGAVWGCLLVVTYMVEGVRLKKGVKKGIPKLQGV